MIHLLQSVGDMTIDHHAVCADCDPIRVFCYLFGIC